MPGADRLIVLQIGLTRLKPFQNAPWKRQRLCGRRSTMQIIQLGSGNIFLFRQIKRGAIFIQRLAGSTAPGTIRRSRIKAEFLKRLLNIAYGFIGLRRHSGNRQTKGNQEKSYYTQFQTLT